MSGTLPSSEDLAVFAAIHDAGGLNGAARRLGLPRSTVSRRLARLEEVIGAKLFLRNRQQLTLSDTGQALVAQARLVLQELRTFADAASSAQVAPRGRLRVTAARDLASYATVWLDFAQRYPEVGLEIELSNRYVDVVAEGFDVALRGGLGDDETLVAKRVGHYALVAVATPDYVARHGLPSSPTALRDHSCILLQPMRAKGGRVRTPPSPHRNLVVDDVAFAQRACLRGMGIAILPLPLVAAYLDSGRLLAVLDAYNPLEVPLYAMVPERAFMRAAVSAFIEFVAERF